MQRIKRLCCHWLVCELGKLTKREALSPYPQHLFSPKQNKLKADSVTPSTTAGRKMCRGSGSSSAQCPKWLQVWDVYLNCSEEHQGPASRNKVLRTRCRGP